MLLNLIRVEILIGALVARSAILAGPRGALLHICLAVAARESLPAAALEAVDQVAAGGVVAARPNRALVNVRLAVGALVAGVRTVAGVQVDPVQTLTAVQAGQRSAVVNVHLSQR